MEPLDGVGLLYRGYLYVCGSEEKKVSYKRRRRVREQQLAAEAQFERTRLEMLISIFLTKIIFFRKNQYSLAAAVAGYILHRS